jgi:hypothetical protein
VREKQEREEIGKREAGPCVYACAPLAFVEGCVTREGRGEIWNQIRSGRRDFEEGVVILGNDKVGGTR